jgi:hypothetical protein
MLASLIVWTRWPRDTRRDSHRTDRTKRGLPRSGEDPPTCRAQESWIVPDWKDGPAHVTRAEDLNILKRPIFASSERRASARGGNVVTRHISGDTAGMGRRPGRTSGRCDESIRGSLVGYMGDAVTSKYETI